MKLNNKGFAVSTILYGILALIILILLIIFGVMKANKDMNEDLVESLTNSMNSCVAYEIKLENCYFKKGDCEEEKALYESCLYELKPKTLAEQILSDNRVQSDVSLSFSPKYSSVKSDIKTMTVPSTTNYYYFGHLYTFNSTTGKYSINKTYAYDTWSSLAASALIPTTPYTCFAESSTATCDKLYQIATSTSGSSSYTGYVYEAVQDPVGDGLYSTSKNTEGNLPTYYFRGNVENNYVKFGKNGGCAYNGNPVYYVYATEEGEGYSVPCEQGYCGVREVLTAKECSSSQVYAVYNRDINYEPTTIKGYYVGAVDVDAHFDGFSIDYTGKTATYGDNAVDMLWRIVRINEDGSVRLMYNESIGQYNFNYYIDDNSGAGYMYGQTNAATYELTHKNTNDSTVKQVLDVWYENNLKDNYSTYMADAGFCNDRSLYSGTGLGFEQAEYGAYNRLSLSKAPQFKCNQTNDLFTTKKSGKGNKALTYPIGMLTADEIMYAGMTGYVCSNSNQYLTMTPMKLGGSGMLYYFGCNLSNGFSNVGLTTQDVIPVINVKGDLEVISGNGTKDNPYIV